MRQQATPASSRLRWRAAFTTLALALGALVVGAQPASAHGFTGLTRATGCNVNVGDNATQTYFNQGADSRVWNAVTWTRANNIDPTDITTTTDSTFSSQTDVGIYSGDFSGNSNCLWTDTDGRQYYRPWCCETPVVSQLGHTIPFLAGAAWIQALNSAGEVEQHRVYFETDNLTNAGWSTNYLHALICHETGHTLGLSHLGGTCMTDPADASQIGFAADQRTHINAWYPEQSG